MSNENKIEVVRNNLNLAYDVALKLEDDNDTLCDDIRAALSSLDEYEEGQEKVGIVDVDITLQTRVFIKHNKDHEISDVTERAINFAEEHIRRQLVFTMECDFLNLSGDYKETSSTDYDLDITDEE